MVVLKGIILHRGIDKITTLKTPMANYLVDDIFSQYEKDNLQSFLLAIYHVIEDLQNTNRTSPQ
jgi:hypothetical protein